MWGISRSWTYNRDYISVQRAGNEWLSALQQESVNAAFEMWAHGTQQDIDDGEMYDASETVLQVDPHRPYYQCSTWVEAIEYYCGSGRELLHLVIVRQGVTPWMGDEITIYRPAHHSRRFDPLVWDLLGIEYSGYSKKRR